jgi:periplasmic copper chaperone A
MTRILMLGVMFFFVVVPTTIAQTATVEVVQPWARAATGNVGVVYMTIKNTGTVDDRLVAAATPVAEQAQLHISINRNGVMSMRPLSSIAVKANGQAILKPGGMHLMLVGLKQPLTADETFPLTLTFQKAGNLAVTVAVRQIGSMGGMKM